MWITNDLTSLSLNFTLQRLSKLKFQTSRPQHSISLGSSALKDYQRNFQARSLGSPNLGGMQERRRDIKEAFCLSEQPQGLSNEICNALVAACPKNTALPVCQQLGLKWPVPDSEVMGWARVPTTEVSDIHSSLCTSIAPQANMVTQSCCPVNQGRGGRRHLNWELGKKRKPLHLGFDEKTEGWTGKRGGQAISLGEIH